MSGYGRRGSWVAGSEDVEIWVRRTTEEEMGGIGTSGADSW